MGGDWRIDPAIRGESANRQSVVLAEAQHAMVHRQQLLAIGLCSSAIDRRVAEGRLHVMYRGVYAVGHRVVTLKGRWMAAVRACGPGAALSHRGALDHHRPDTHPTRNDLEELLIYLCRQAGLPLPSAVNASLDLPGVGRIEPDAIWRDHRVIVEVDGFETHATRAMFESDRIRDAELQILGWRVLRTTWRQLERTPHEFVDRLRRLLQTG